MPFLASKATFQDLGLSLEKEWGPEADPSIYYMTALM